MLSANVVLVTALAYVALLFIVAFVSDRRARAGRVGLAHSPLIYTLSISVYCTSWTFYGAVGSAARDGLEFVTIYLGPTLVFVGWWFVLRKLVRIGRVHRISSVADLVSSRYGKSTTLAVLVTVIAVIASTPYIALQLKAVTISFSVVGSAGNEAVIDVSTAFWVAAGMAAFTILFGTRNIDANERHHGVVAAIALEALVKLIALLAVGIFVVFGVAGGLGEVFAMPGASIVIDPDTVYGPRWVAMTFLAGTAILCLPRQFQVTVVENADEAQLRTASWLFPLYLFLMCCSILPIAIAGLTLLPPGANPDMFVLTLPMAQGQDALALLAFIGGFSSATSMVIVACIALSIMVSNHIVIPVVLRLPVLSQAVSGDMKRLLLVSRRVSIGLLLLLGFGYFVASAQSDALAAMGLIAFAGAAQILPAMVGGLYWRSASKAGAAAGMFAGFVVWIYTLVLPNFEGVWFVTQTLMVEGPWGLGWLRPHALFGVQGEDPMVHSVFWSMTVNVVLFVVVSLIREQNPLERLQGTLFVDVFRNPAESEGRFITRSATVDDLYIMTQRILGAEEAQRVFAEFAQRQGAVGDMPRPDAAFISHLERLLAGGIGAASARVMISQVVTGETISLDELIRLVDETQQVIEYSQRLEAKSQELQDTAKALQDANERLRMLDAQKDDFLSQVSHEVRTPMASIRSFSEILLDNPDLESERSRKYLKIIQDETLRLSRLLDEILDVSHLDSGQFALRLEEVDAARILEHAVETCRGMAASAGVTIDYGACVAEAPIRADGDRLAQVFMNILSNAIKYNTSEEPRVTVSSRVDGGTYFAYVDDNGPGIPAEDRERIFAKFARGRELTPGHRTGAGLGLSISRSIARMLGGDLELLPEPGRGMGRGGARFRLRLPLRRETAAAAGE
ncbi:ATP-binding protein [Thalassobaculum sp. OXR-137]|uniref:ATP-binding protein n=1 Tax=Thalassobaculum sp. OXR-137 TaxID=3100173 RepID=UPI002AC9E662|nr:ATP-binding protein [Thalassobaculum sp. OXR-137]WPZ32577.1 ATP-binding protein [Thalassobaculum sp. OXR-137]